MISDEVAEKWLAVHDEVQPLVLAHKFDEACALLTRRRDDAAAELQNELAASLSSFLATCLTMTQRDSEALIAAETAERLDPSSVEAKMSSARVLLNFIGDPERARTKAEELLGMVPAGNPLRYGTLALFGTALARSGHVQAAVGVFHEMTSPEMLAGLRSAEYVGVFDLELVNELVRAGVAKEECRRYLEVVRSVPNEWPHIQRQLDELLAAVTNV
ncbi:MAG TPA: hypothetical protein VEK79_10730 [Thermoanaerobaculia bacterium]|nr:hypothetical protein [Thermoanaerobaculia bacterium]